MTLLIQDGEASSLSPSIGSLHSAEAVDRLAKRIKARDEQVDKHVHEQWLENGRDLLEAKALLGHGRFEPWCREALSYSARTAQNLMRAAEMWDDWCKGEPGSVLPRPTMIYALSAPSVPQEIRDRFAPRIIAGENILSEIRSAIRRHRESIKVIEGEKTRSWSGSSGTEAAQADNGGSEAQSLMGDAGDVWVVQEENLRAYHEVLDLIQARLGQDLPKMLALVKEAGGCIFTSSVEGELWSRAQGTVAGPAEVNAVAL